MAESSHPVFAALYDRFMAAGEWRVARHRPWVVGEARGRVLEVGAGTGASFPHYRRARSVVAVEPDPFMRARAARRLAALPGRPAISLASGSAEALDFPDGAFDTVVSALVFCTVPDPRRGLAEVRRVLRPGGEFRFIEHVRAEGGLAGGLQDGLTPLWRHVSAGCHLNRRTLDAIRRAGLDIGEVRRDVLPPGIPLVVGVARKGD